MKTNELTGAALNWAVAMAEGVKVLIIEQQIVWPEDYEPSTNWALGGPIIEREGFCVQPKKRGWECFVHVRIFDDDCPYSEGPTPLIAAMRCYVASKLGEEVDIPKELAP